MLHVANAQPQPVRPVMPPMVAPTVAGASVVLGQLEMGVLTAKQAWESGQLTVNDLVRAANAPRLFSSEKTEDVRLRETLVQLLVEHGQDRWMPVPAPDNKEAETEKPKGERLSEAVRLAIADSLSKVRDERAVAVYEDMLLPLERTRPNLRAVGALNHLGSFYWDQGKLQQAADVFLRGEKYSSSPEWAAAIRLDAARIYTQMGNVAKAKELYDQVPQFGNGWISILSLYDQALPFIQLGEFKKAEEILSQPLKSITNDHEGKMIQNTWLAKMAYNQGKLDEVVRYSQAAMDLGDNTNFANGSIKGLYDSSKIIYEVAKRWKDQPIQSDLKEVVIKFNSSQSNKPLYSRFIVKTYGDAKLTATVNNPLLRVTLLPVKNWHNDTRSAKEEEIEVVVQVPETLQKIKRQQFELTLKSNSDFYSAGKTAHFLIFINDENPRN